jgi:hypothetical protein
MVVVAAMEVVTAVDMQVMMVLDMGVVMASLEVMSTEVLEFI